MPPELAIVPAAQRRAGGRNARSLTMHALPVTATTVAAYRLVAREFPTVVRLSWAVLAILALLQLFLARTVLGQMAAALGRGDIMMAAAIARDPLWLTLKFGFDAVGTAIVAVAVHELVLFGDRKPGASVHVAFGRREALFAALGLALVAVTIPFATIVISPFGDPTTGFAPFLASVAFVAAMYVAVRLWPILPIIVVEGRLDLAKAWAMTRGRFWSLAALAILGLVPVLILALSIDAVLPPFDSLMDSITNARVRVPRVAEAMQAVRRAQSWLPLRVLFEFLNAIVYTAVAVALISLSYKALLGRSFDDPLHEPDARAP
jgi:hypothetical protein